MISTHTNRFDILSLKSMSTSLCVFLKGVLMSTLNLSIIAFKNDGPTLSREVFSPNKMTKADARVFTESAFADYLNYGNNRERINQNIDYIDTQAPDILSKEDIDLLSRLFFITKDIRADENLTETEQTAKAYLAKLVSALKNHQVGIETGNTAITAQNLTTVRANVKTFIRGVMSDTPFE
jgi:hypothetical protein